MTPKEPTATAVEKILRDLIENRKSKIEAEEQLMRMKEAVASGQTSTWRDGGRKLRAMIANLEAALQQLQRQREREIDQQSKTWLSVSLVGPSPKNGFAEVQSLLSSLSAWPVAEGVGTLHSGPHRWSWHAE